MPITDEAIVFGVLLLSLVLFVTGKWRYDLVALLALLTLTVVGIVPASAAFQGFGHPAVITVAAVLVLSRALYSSGVVDILANWSSRIPEYLTLRIASLSSLTAFLSAFMNNVGAVSLLMPVAVRLSNRTKVPPSLLLMPLAFASLLGGMMTLIGTPPNIIISKFRQDEVGVPFSMFDFAMVGLPIAVAGVCFMTFVGWRLIPSRRASVAMGDTLDIEDYMTEVRAPYNSRCVGMLVRDLEDLTEENVAIVGLVRRGVVYGAPSSYEIIDANDIFIIEADPEGIKAFMDATGFVLEGARDIRQEVNQSLGSGDVSVVEAIVVPDSSAHGSSARNLHLHAEFGVNLLGVSRRGTRFASQLGRIMWRAGDVLLLQGKTEIVQGALRRLGLLPLAERELRVGQPRQLLIPVVVFGSAVALAALDILPIQISFAVAVAVLLITRLLTLHEAYRAVDWPVIMLLGAMIPVGEALETTGGAARIAAMIAGLGGDVPAWAMLGIVLVTAMLLSAVINNAAAVILMAPIGVGVAEVIGASSDPFLMAVAIGGSSAFMTPIGHQSNTIVMGPGGYHFADYLRVGLPLSVLLVAISIPMIILVWPLGVV